MSDQQQPREQVTFVRSEPSREEAILAVVGPLLDENADEFQRALDELLAGGWPVVTLDLSKVKAMASKPMGKIVFMKNRLEEKHRMFRIRGCDDSLSQQFLMVKFDRIIDISPQA